VKKLFSLKHAVRAIHHTHKEHRSVLQRILLTHHATFEASKEEKATLSLVYEACKTQ